MRSSENQKVKVPIIFCLIKGFVWPAAKGKWSSVPDLMDSSK